ncbi:MlaD family protein [Mycolicibacterium septicum]|uniref:MlaD family protein n=1 Tax=Mycolicibacterium septicum TaxID=98668 RepID=UPI002360A444|nr:MlaD family protein [Mycolicibacterium septicum]
MAFTRFRSFRRVSALVLSSLAVAGLGGGCAQRGEEQRATEYCAIMPDAVGLYVGNPVTQMGFGIGKVKAITPSPTDVRVDFTLDSDRPIPDDVKAVIRSTSILADRSLELAGNFESGPRLLSGQCIPVTHSMTPKSLSEVIGSSTNFVNSINPNGSSNVGDVVREIDQAAHNNGAGMRQLLTMSSAALDSPDQAVSDIGSIMSNLGQLTSMLTETMGPMKQIIYDARTTTLDVATGVTGGGYILSPVPTLIRAVSDLESNIGTDFQSTLDAASMALRKASAHAPALTDLLNPVPWWINAAANHSNNRQYNTLGYRLPLYRIRAPGGLAVCNIMNASMPGSCADVQGQPFAVDVALLQYVLTEAAKK